MKYTEALELRKQAEQDKVKKKKSKQTVNKQDMARYQLGHPAVPSWWFSTGIIG